MALVPSGSGKELALAQDGSAKTVSPEEQAKRIEEAKQLEEKLNYIQTEVPTRIFNVSGSTAGAGSGDFHQYRTARRREQFRLMRIEKAAKEQEEREEFELQRQKRLSECEERTSKRRAKRQKKKEKQRAKKSGGVSETDQPDQKDDGQGEDSGPEQAALD
mmetsp:Transcript_1940/g.4582  ORF Transcript_1940/g.4582 Transcript_1940/m.4582 type:complete len:161 (+) Transcript_1940:178-660(+)|eukprot:CAMPEP_0177591176 /NCGR_PEP_ID=MMETSP0419_2-20121207/7846_1 /TAXON_ID=582737 /ORGANISM="Tetraselmis sp., Strain GSL018" /LENGTH=160 /DNA_ID=CAMNT_0019081877 /DNA_START=72 /DNA_END=554 /DNA_ORIENTATION=+